MSDISEILYIRVHYIQVLLFLQLTFVQYFEVYCRYMFRYDKGNLSLAEDYPDYNDVMLMSSQCDATADRSTLGREVPNSMVFTVGKEFNSHC